MRAWRDAGIPQRHADSLGLRTTATGLWMATYTRLKGKIGEGLTTALIGPRGTGKTQMAVCLLRDAADAGKIVRYIKAMDLFRELRACFRKDGPDEIKTMNQFARYGLLVIDEAHERGETDFENRTLTGLIDHRYDAMRDTILISNQTEAALAASIGPSIVSRMKETGECIACNWASYR